MAVFNPGAPGGSVFFIRNVFFFSLFISPGTLG